MRRHVIEPLIPRHPFRCRLRNLSCHRLVIGIWQCDHTQSPNLAVGMPHPEVFRCHPSCPHPSPHTTRDLLNHSRNPPSKARLLSPRLQSGGNLSSSLTLPPPITT